MCVRARERAASVSSPLSANFRRNAICFSSFFPRISSNGCFIIMMIWSVHTPVSWLARARAFQRSGKGTPGPAAPPRMSGPNPSEVPILHRGFGPLVGVFWTKLTLCSFAKLARCFFFYIILLCVLELWCPNPRRNTLNPGD